MHDVLITPLVPGSPIPLHRQLYDSLREAILTGRMATGRRIPATRRLARDLDVSRNTVLAAVDQLLAEGYIETRRGSGTYVASRLPDEMVKARASTPLPPGARSSGVLLSRRADVMVAGWEPASSRLLLPGPLQLAVPAVEQFPHETWARMASRIRRHPPVEVLVYGDPAGYGPLREAIAERLRANRAARCDANQVIITSGAQQGFLLAAQLLLNPGEWAWIEEPGYLGARKALLASGVRMAPIPVDDEGLDVGAGRRLCSKARMAFVTPSYQAALGITMSLRRRLELLEWARRNRAWIVEDDHNSDYRYVGRPLASLQGLDSDGRVIYVGTLSKVMFPALRLGYVVVPASLIDAFSAAKDSADRHAPTVLQAEVAAFITEGHLERHIRRMRALYLHRQEVLVEEAARVLRGQLQVGGSPAGIHVLGWLAPEVDDRLAAQMAAKHDVAVTPLSAAYSSGGAPRPALMLGYACCDDETIRRAVRRLRSALAQLESVSVKD